MWLLKFPMVACTLANVVCNTHFISSLVVVFPLLPVRPMTGQVQRRLCQRARDCSASSASGTKMKRESPIGACLPSSTTAAMQPASMACCAYALPLKFSPFKAKNNWPAPAARVSVVIPVEASKLDWMALNCGSESDRNMAGASRPSSENKKALQRAGLFVFQCGLLMTN